MIAAPICQAQRTASNPLGGGLSVQDAGTCSTTGSFLWQQLPSNAATTTVNLAGTFSGTLTIRLSNNGGGTWTTNTTVTTGGTTSIATNGFTDICADVTTFTSGVFQVTITTGLNTGPQGPPGPGGGITQFSANVIDPTNAKYGAKANQQIETTGANFTVTSGSAIVICTTCKFQTSTYHAATVGDGLFSTNWPGTDITGGTSVAVLKNGTTPVTIISVDSDTQVHVSVNASGNAGTTNANNGALWWGTLDDGSSAGGANANTPWSLAETASNGGINCLPVQAPAGITEWSQAHFNNNAPTCRGISGGSTASHYQALIGWAIGNNSTVVIPPWFNRATCSATSCTGASSLMYMSFNGLGQGEFNGTGTGSFVATVNDQSYEDDAFWLFGCGTGNAFGSGVTLNGGYHTFRNITVDEFGNAAITFAGQDHDVFEWFASNQGCASGPSVVVTGNTGSFGGAFNIGAGGIGIQVQNSASYWSYNELQANAAGVASACIKGNTGTHIYIRGLGCQNSGVTNSVAIQANGGQVIAEESVIGGGATGKAFDCSVAGSSCSAGVGGNQYSANPIGTIGCAAGTGTSPAACSANDSGLVAVNTGLTSFTVNTTAVTPNSTILIQQDTSTTAGTALGVTCNTTVSTALPLLTAKTTGTSFAFSLTAPATNPDCFSFKVIN